MKTLHSLRPILLIICFFTTGLLPQPFYNANPDSANEKPTQYRRTIELNKNYMGSHPFGKSYEEKYRGKDLEKVKSSQFPLTGTGVWTELNPKVPRVDYAGIHFVNKDTGWAVGDLGALIKTTNGGLSWKVIQTNTTTPILKVRSYNGQIVIATGYDGLILRSTDGGDSFVHILSRVGAGFDLWGLELINDTVGWACGATALLKTTDGGENWQRINTPGYTGNLWWIDFMPAPSGNEQYGFAAADGKVLRTTDGGNNWEVLQAGDNRPLYSIDIIDSLHIAAAGYGGTNFLAKNIYSSDGGYTWVNGGFLTTEDVNCIRYIDRDTGYLVMNGTGYFKTTDRGQNWAQVSAAIGEYEFSLVNNNIGYSAGTSLKIYKTEGNLESWRKLILNEDFSDVFFINEYKGFVITSSGQGKLFKTENGGVSWQLAAGAPGGGEILFIDSVTGFIGSSNGNIYKTTDGGQSWYPTNGVPNNIGKIQFINAQTGWAAGGRVILKTTDSGENWVTQISRPATSFTSIYFIDSLIGWATALNSPPFKTTDGGQNWVRQTNLDFWQSNDIYLNDFLNGFIIISPSKLYRTVDGGNNWYIQESFQNFIRNFGWITKSHGFIMGDGVFETSDSGNTWSEVMQLRNVGLRKFYAPVDYLGYAVGSTGLILQYFDSLYVPVELIFFQGESNNNLITLTWQTVSETNNRGFEIERSEFTDKIWATVGFRQGSGTTTEEHKYSYQEVLEKPGIYRYRLKQIDYNGRYECSPAVELNSNFALSYNLSQNYPNPFNPITKISYSLPAVSRVKLTIYDILGKEIAVLVNEEKEAGEYEVAFDASGLGSGIYFYHLSASDKTLVRKMLLVK